MLDRLEKEVAMLQRHLHVLEEVRAHKPIGIVAMAKKTKYPRHKIRYSLRQLEDAGVVEPTNEGATTTDQTSAFISEMNETIEESVETLERVRERGDGA